MKILKEILAASLFLVLTIGCSSTGEREPANEQLEAGQTNQENAWGLWKPWAEPGWP